MTLQIGEVNIETGEIVLRDMTEDEIAKHNSDLQAEQMRIAEIEASKIEADAKKTAALEKLAALGLEIDDLKALGLG